MKSRTATKTDSKPRRWNIIYVVVHDLGRHLGCYGVPVTSPNLDRFASEGVVFNNAFCSSAVCSPSRGCAMSGMYAHNNGIVGLTHFGWRFSPGVKTVTDYFNEGGYDTIHCGLSHEGEADRSRYQLDFERSWRCTGIEHAMDDAIAVLHQRVRMENPRPFYMNIGTTEVHRSAYTPEKTAEGFPGRIHQFYQHYGGPIPLDSVHVPPHTPDLPAYREFLVKFQAAIRYMDMQVNRLFRAVDELGLGNDTLVVFTTDHGVYGMRAKGSLYDSGMEIALLLQPPRLLQHHAQHDCLIQNIDIVPTLLEAAGLPIPSHLPGKSCWPLIAGQPYTPHREIFTEWNFGGGYDDFNPARAVRTARHHLILNLGKKPVHRWLPQEVQYDQAPSSSPVWTPWPDPVLPEEGVELYDLENDPHEFRNAGSRPDLQSVRVELETKIQNWMHATDDYLVTGGEPPRPPATPGHSIPREMA